MKSIPYVELDQGVQPAWSLMLLIPMLLIGAAPFEDLVDRP